MNYGLNRMGAAILLGGVAWTPAAAQYGAQAKQQTQATASAPAAQGPKIKVSAKASKAIAELQTTVNANDSANLPAKLAAAQAVASTPDDRYAIGQLWLKAAIAQKDNAATAQALDLIMASGKAPADMMSTLRLNQAKLKFQAKDYAGASAALQPLLSGQPSDDTLLLSAEIAAAQGQSAQAVASLQRAVAARTAAGQPAPAAWLARAVSIAYKAKLPALPQLLVDWVRASPTPSNVRDAVRIQSELSGASETEQLDLYRLQRAAGALKGEADYYRYAQGAASRGLPAEAKAVLDEGFASNGIKRSAPAFSALYPAVSGKVAADKASLASAERSALAGSAAKPVMVTGDAYLGYNEYAKAAALYRAALGKSGVDTNLANLRLGIALARSGDKAGATAAFNAVSGNQQATAKLWLAWLASR